jgi:hypothetical protein
VQLVNLTLDNRVSCSFIESPDLENIIFCRPLEESLDDVCLITTKGSEFIHNYLIESTGNYLVTDVTLPDGKVCKDIKFKLVVSEDIELPYSVINPASLIGYSYSNNISSGVTLLEEQQVLESEQLDEGFNQPVELLVTEDSSVVLNKVREIGSELEQEIDNLLTEHQNYSAIDSERVFLEKTAKIRKIFFEKIENVSSDINAVVTNIEGKFPKLDEAIKNINTRIENLLIEKKSAGNIPDTTRQYIDHKISKVTEEVSSYARRILELGSGGGSVAVQYANGGTMNGNLNVTGKYLSGGVDIGTLFSGGGGGGNQTLSFNSVTANLSISNGNTVSLSALSGSGSAGNPAVNSLVISNSANWNNSYTTLTANSANWSNVYTTNISNSGNWDVAYNVATIYQSASGSFVSNTLLQSTSALLTPLTTTNSLTSQLVLNTTLNSLSSNWQNTYTITNTNSANWSNAYTTLNANSGTLTTITSNSANWNNAYTTTSSNSANWNNAYTATSTTSANWNTAYGSTTALNLSSNNWNNTYTSYSTNSGSFITAVSGTPNQINASKSGTTVTLSLPNSAVFPGNVTILGNLSAQGTATFANTVFTTTSALSAVANSSGPALYIGQSGSGDLASFYDLSPTPVEVLHVGASVGIPGVGIYTSTPNKELTVVGEISATKTIYASGGNSNNWNSVYSLVNTTTATTFNVNNLTTTGRVGIKQTPLYFDADVANIGNSYGTFGIGALNDVSITPNNNLVLSPAVGYNVGVNTSAPNQKLTVVGNISGTAVIYVSGGNSDQWNNAYTIATTYQNASGSFATYTTLQSTSALLTPLTTTNSLTSQLVLNTTLNSLSSNWQNTYTTVYTNSGTWVTYSSLNTGSFVPYTAINTVSGNWNSAYTSTTAINLSTGFWNNVYTTVQSYSSTWGTGGSSTTDTGVRALTANWQNTYTTVSANSATTWNYQGTDLKNLSSGWIGGNSAYTWVNTNSAIATFTTSVSAPALSGIHYGDGSKLTGIASGGNLSLYLPLSGGALTGVLTTTSTVSALSSITAYNLAAQNQVQYLSSGVVKVYQYYNTSTNSLDTVFN